MNTFIKCFLVLLITGLIMTKKSSADETLYECFHKGNSAFELRLHDSYLLLKFPPMPEERMMRQNYELTRDFTNNEKRIFGSYDYDGIRKFGKKMLLKFSKRIDFYNPAEEIKAKLFMKTITASKYDSEHRFKGGALLELILNPYQHVSRESISVVCRQKS